MKAFPYIFSEKVPAFGEQKISQKLQAHPLVAQLVELSTEVYTLQGSLDCWFDWGLNE